MNAVEQFPDIMRVYDKLSDDESRLIFKARLELMSHRDEFKFYDALSCLNKTYICPEFEKFINKFSETQKLIIFGVTNEGKRTYDILMSSKHKDNVYAFSDYTENLLNIDIYKLPVIPFTDLINHKDCVVIVANHNLASQINQQLSDIGFSQENIYVPEYDQFVGINDLQYFDVFQPSASEIFVDAGCFNGDTSVQFANWCNGNYEAIYAFEPNPNFGERCLEAFKKNNIDNVEFVPKGTWFQDDVLTFSDSGGGSCIGDAGGLSVPVTSIDKVLNGRPVTFIKMDVERSELFSLVGAQETIKKYRPRLAISVYHKLFDVVELSSYILTLVPDYKFTIRHYMSNMWETVLYAE